MEETCSFVVGERMVIDRSWKFIKTNAHSTTKFFFERGKNMKKTIFATVAAVALVFLIPLSEANADILAGWDFGSSVPANQGTDPATGTPTVLASGVTVSGVLDGVGGLSGFTPFVHASALIGDNTGVAASGTTFGRTDSGNFGSTTNGAQGGGGFGNTFDGAIDQNDYWTFTLTADVAGTLNISDFSVDIARANAANAATDFNVLAQVNGGSTWLSSNALFGTDQLVTANQGLGDWGGFHLDLSGNSTFQNINSVEFRVYHWGSNGTSASSRINVDQLVVEGSIAIPEPTSLGLLGLGMVGLLGRRRR